jgi:serine protease Do
VAGLEIVTKVQLKAIRDKKEQTFDVTIGEQPKDLARGGEPAEEGAQADGGLAGLTVHDISPEFAQRFGLPDEEEGVVVTRVEPGSAVEDAGVQRGDLILEINRRAVPDVKDFSASPAGSARTSRSCC